LSVGDLTMTPTNPCFQDSSLAGFLTSILVTIWVPAGMIKLKFWGRLAFAMREPPAGARVTMLV